jgi:hypothetical protein
MAVYTPRIPRWHPRKLNDLIGCHFGTRARRKRSDREIVAGHALEQGIPHALGKRLVKLHLVLRPRQRAGDPDAYHKSLLDALVACGLLVNDNRQHVELGPVSFQRGTAAEWGTVIEIEDCE